MDMMHLSPSVYRNLKRDFGQNTMADALGYFGTAFGGIPVQESRAFPRQFKCSVCDGTGKGETSTYCQRCKGAGEVRVVGMMGTTIIVDTLPKAFLPGFPSGLVALPPIARGLP